MPKTDGYLELLHRTLKRLETAVFDEGTPPRDLASLTRRLLAVFLVKSVFRVSSLIFFGFRHEECRPVVCFTGCPSCRT